VGNQKKKEPVIIKNPLPNINDSNSTLCSVGLSGIGTNLLCHRYLCEKAHVAIKLYGPHIAALSRLPLLNPTGSFAFCCTPINLGQRGVFSYTTTRNLTFYPALGVLCSSPQAQRS
jgi:hypothetical protein